MWADVGGLQISTCTSALLSGVMGFTHSASDQNNSSWLYSKVQHGWRSVLFLVTVLSRPSCLPLLLAPVKKEKQFSASLVFLIITLVLSKTCLMNCGSQLFCNYRSISCPVCGYIKLTNHRARWISSRPPWTEGRQQTNDQSEVAINLPVWARAVWEGSPDTAAFEAFIFAAYRLLNDK